MKKIIMAASVALIGMVTVAEEYPFLCWTYHRFEERGSDENTIEDWKGLGINRPLTPIMDGKTDKPAFKVFLDKCLAAGIRPIVWDDRIAAVNMMRLIEKDPTGGAYRACVKECFAEFAKHPAVSGYYVADEPDVNAISAACLAAKIQKEEAPHLKPYLNLLPWFDSIAGRIGAKSETEQLDRAGRESGLDELGYDCYAHMAGNENDYFHNLHEWALWGKRAGKRWNTTLLCVPHYNYRINSQDDFRWQISTAAAMGAKGISWFFPDMHAADPSDNFRDAPVNVLGKHSVIYDWLGTEACIFQRQFGATMMELTWEKVCIKGKTQGGIPAFESDSGVVDVWNGKDVDILVSYFHDTKGVRYVAFVALDRTRTFQLGVSIAPGVKADRKTFRGWEPLATTYDPLRLEQKRAGVVYMYAAPGQLFLLRLR